jgi:hypothetical protein
VPAEAKNAAEMVQWDAAVELGPKAANQYAVWILVLMKYLTSWLVDEVSFLDTCRIDGYVWWLKINEHAELRRC